MSRAISSPLWQLLKPDDKGYSPFTKESNANLICWGDPGDGWWAPFGKDGLVFASSLNVTESTRIVVEGRFRPVGDHAALRLELVNSQFFSVTRRITETVKIGFALDGQREICFSSINGVLASERWFFINPAHNLQVRCVAIGGDAECDWLACSEVEI